MSAAPWESIIVKWSGKEYAVKGLSEKSTVEELKQLVEGLTGVLVDRQKLLGLKTKGRPASDDTTMAQLTLKPGMKVMMMGTREDILADANKVPEDLPEVLNDFDIEEEEVALQDREEHLAKIARRVKEYDFKELCEPREGKKLLVLDIDYTLFDHRSTAECGAELTRPYLHEFLTAAFKHFNICIWSATGMKWIEAKLKEMRIDRHPDFNIFLLLDSRAMISVHTPKYGVVEVKPLGVIWGKYPQFSAENSLIIDDLRRNFLMNPQSGLRIRPFREAHFNRDKDRELYYLSKYLMNIAPVYNFTLLNHRKWESFRLEEFMRTHPPSEVAEADVQD